MNTDPINPETLERLKEFPKSFGAQLDRAEGAIKQALLVARALDRWGKACDHEPGTEKHALAKVRDEVDRVFSEFAETVAIEVQVHVKFTFCDELLWHGATQLKGAGAEALEAIERGYELHDDESVTLEKALWRERVRLQEAGVTPAEIEARADEIEARAKAKVGMVDDPETMVATLAWETYERVQALQEFARKYPKHVTHTARLMHGWPMVVCQHLDHRPEFEEMVTLLKVGAGYPLDVFARGKRGSGSPMLRYLDPLIISLDGLHCLTNRFRPDEAALDRFLEDRWDSFMNAWRTGVKTKPEVVAGLRGIAAVGRLTKGTARDWTTKVLVPLIMVTDAKTPETCEEPALQNIWRHEAVKSPATFKSRLHSQVWQTVERYAWEKRPDEEEDK